MGEGDSIRDTGVKLKECKSSSEDDKAESSICHSKGHLRFRSTLEMLVYQCMQFEEMGALVHSWSNAIFGISEMWWDES